MNAVGIGLLGFALTLQAWSQGIITVANRVRLEDLDAPVFDSDCLTRLEGDSYLAQAYVGFTSDSLSPLGSRLSFRTGPYAGYIVPVVLTVPGTGSRDVVYFQLRAWEARAGPSYEAAVAVGGKHGFSNIVPMMTVLPPAAPNDPLGLQSFCLVPEPSAGKLGWFAAVALALLATRNSTLHRASNLGGGFKGQPRASPRPPCHHNRHEDLPNEATPD